MNTIDLKIPRSKKATTESTLAAYAAVGAAACAYRRLMQHAGALTAADVVKPGAPAKKQTIAMHKCKAAYEDAVTDANRHVREDANSLEAVLKSSRQAVDVANSYIDATRIDKVHADCIAAGNPPV